MIKIQPIRAKPRLSWTNESGELWSHLKTSHVRTEERSKLAPTAASLALVTQLVVQHVGLHLHLGADKVTQLLSPLTSRDYSVLTLLSISPCWSWTNLAEMAAM